MMERRRILALALTVAALIFIAVETLIPAPSQALLVAQTPIWCVVCGELGVVDVLLNIALFVPLGAGLILLGLPWRRAVLIGAGLSLAIEVTQYFAIVGRDASLGDVLTNTAGTALGGFLARSWRSWLLPVPRRAVALCVVATGVWLLQVGLAGAAVLPALPESTYWGQRAPELGQFDTFHGRLLEALVGTSRLPSYRLPNSGEIRDHLLHGAPLRAVAAPAGATRRLAPIVSIFDEQQREIALLGQSGNDLVFRIHTRAFDLRLRPPALRAPDVFRADSGQVLALDGALLGHRLIVQARTPDRQMVRGLDLSAQWGWSLLLPFEYAAGPEVGWLSAMWVGGWLAAIGYWLRRTGIPAGRATVVALAGLAAGLAGVPALLGLRGSLSEWIGGAVGLALGWALAHATARYATALPKARSAASP